MRRSVIYLDDEPGLLEIFEEMFGDEYDVRTAATPTVARRLLAETAADVIISDQRMPEMDGVDFLREVARLYPHSLRILVSGYVKVIDVMAAVGTGTINVFVPKPWTNEYMAQVLERSKLALDEPEAPPARAGERRIAPRHQITLETRVLIFAEPDGDEGGGLTITGYTQDISESGVALIVTPEDMQALSTYRETYTLRLMLTLPSGPIELAVAPVRHQRLTGEVGTSFLIGAQIINMKGRDRVRFMEYIHSLSVAASAVPHEAG